jgi:outer membrane lipoprotein-sorting protein
LPRLTAQQLLVKVQTGSVRSLSGTVRMTAALGLPSLPDAQAGSASLSWQSFLLGSHDARIWVRGATRQRVAVLGQLSEADIVHNRRDLWTYTSSTNTVTHAVLPSRSRSAGSATEAYSPAALAEHLLRAVRPSTSVSVARTQVVAGRPAYTLDIRPRDARSTVREVAIAVDAHTFLPLQVQVFGSGTSPAFQVGFSSISYTTPAASRFAFTPPAGAHVSRASVLSGVGSASDRHEPAGEAPGSGRARHARIRVLGSGWTTMAELPAANRASALLGGASLRDVSTPVGTGGARLLHTALVNALVLPDGRVFVGAVQPAMLEHAAATAPR